MQNALNLEKSNGNKKAGAERNNYPSQNDNQASSFHGCQCRCLSSRRGRMHLILSSVPDGRNLFSYSLSVQGGDGGRGASCDTVLRYMTLRIVIHKYRRYRLSGVAVEASYCRRQQYQHDDALVAIQVAYRPMRRDGSSLTLHTQNLCVL